MLKDESYDKVRILYELSKLSWFVQKHAKANAERAGKAADLECIKSLESDLKRHIQAFQDHMCR